MELSRYGEDAIRVLFGSAIDLETHEKVRKYFFCLKSLEVEGVREIIPSFRSCLVRFDTELVTADRLMRTLEGAAGRTEDARVPEPQHVEIPVTYGGDCGPDMDFVTSYSGLDEEQVVDIHTSTIYRVFAVGFMPGFPYLGTLDRRLYVPRLETPRIKVPEGSVGLAQLQTGVYTFESPGGWRIIGRTELALFDYREPPYSLLQIGDVVRFIRA